MRQQYFGGTYYETASSVTFLSRVVFQTKHLVQTLVHHGQREQAAS